MPATCRSRGGSTPALGGAKGSVFMNPPCEMAPIITCWALEKPANRCSTSAGEVESNQPAVTYIGIFDACTAAWRDSSETCVTLLPLAQTMLSRHGARPAQAKTS